MSFSVFNFTKKLITLKIVKKIIHTKFMEKIQNKLGKIFLYSVASHNSFNWSVS